jgi:hypothetical protein
MAKNGSLNAREDAALIASITEEAKQAAAAEIAAYAQSVAALTRLQQELEAKFGHRPFSDELSKDEAVRVSEAERNRHTAHLALDAKVIPVLQRHGLSHFNDYKLPDAVLGSDILAQITSDAANSTTLDSQGKVLGDKPIYVGPNGELSSTRLVGYIELKMDEKPIETAIFAVSPPTIESVDPRTGRAQIFVKRDISPGKAAEPDGSSLGRAGDKKRNSDN